MRSRRVAATFSRLSRDYGYNDRGEMVSGKKKLPAGTQGERMGDSASPDVSACHRLSHMMVVSACLLPGWPVAVRFGI